MSIKKTYIILFILLSKMAFSQDGIPVYSDYFADNLYLLHPSMAIIIIKLLRLDLVSHKLGEHQPSKYFPFSFRSCL